MNNPVIRDAAEIPRHCQSDTLALETSDDGCTFDIEELRDGIRYTKLISQCFVFNIYS